jgi:hypothetical protein
VGKKAVAFLKKSSAKDFCEHVVARAYVPETGFGAKFFCFFFSKKKRFLYFLNAILIGPSARPWVNWSTTGSVLLSNPDAGPVQDTRPL